MSGTSEIGLIGLGTMGSALALNIAETGHDIAVWNRTGSVTTAFAKEAGALASKIAPTPTLQDFVAAIKPPRAIILMVPAGGAVDAQIDALLPLLGPDDLIIDAGNADFHDTNRRTRDLDQPFMGIGVSGGEEGARHGPSIMAGGSKALWQRMAPILQGIAAQYEGTPCAEWMGEEGAGHFVKAVHNGIEYADMQLIAEVYGILRDGRGQGAQAVSELFARWNEGPLQSYLIEITGKVAAVHDDASSGPLLDVIVDAAGQKGTGRWTAVEAQHLAAAIPVIEAAVVARNMSARREDRARFEAIYGAGAKRLPDDAVSEQQLENALMCGKVLAYQQGFEMIASASGAFGWSLQGDVIARTWRAGCIIRSAMLDEMALALGQGEAGGLMAAPYFVDILKRTHGDLRHVVAAAAASGLAVPALSAALAYFDTMRSARGTANMIQAQRDFFGLHGFARSDAEGEGHHGPWG